MIFGAILFIAAAIAGAIATVTGFGIGFDLSKEAFVATATAVGVVVDGARMPAYFVTQGADIKRIWILVLVATLGALIGTLFGERLLRRIPEHRFRQVVAVILLMLGAY